MERRCRARDPPSEIYGYPLNLDAGETEAIAGPRNILPNKNLVTTFYLRRLFHEEDAFTGERVFLVSNTRTREKKKGTRRDKLRLGRGWKSELEKWRAGTRR